MSDWVPSESDILWCKNLIRILKEKAIWGTSAGTYILNKEAKTLTLSVLSPFAKKDEYERIHLRSKTCFKKIGYTVTETDEVRRQIKDKWE